MSNTYPYPSPAPVANQSSNESLAKILQILFGVLGPNGAINVLSNASTIAWGSITGTITNQTDLIAYISGAIAAAISPVAKNKGPIDCSLNPNYPAAAQSDYYYCSVAGLIGGASGVAVEVGDMIMAKVANAGGTQAAVGTSWFILQSNLPNFTTVGTHLVTLTNPSAETYIKVHADNTVTSLTPSQVLTDIGGAPLASPALTGVPTAPTATTGTNTTQLATTSFVQASISAITGVLATVLTGFSATNAVVVATDTVLQGFNKLQGQVSAILSAGYQTAAQVTTAILSYGYQTAAQVTTAITSYGYQTASQVTTAITSYNYAPLASPALTGIPTAPTAGGGSNTTQLATTAFVQSAIPSLSGYAPLASPALTGTPTAPTATTGTNTTQLSTTAFVQAAISAMTGVLATVLTGFTTSNVAVVATDTVLAAFGKLQGQINGLFFNAALTGVPTAPTATGGTNTTQIATTAFVQSALPSLSGYAPLASPALTGTPTAPTATGGTNTTQLATTAFVQSALPSLSGYAPLASPALTGTPTAPTATGGTNTTQVATTAFVQSAIPSLSGYAPLASPALTGIPTAPTATGGTNTTQLATTAFVQSALPSLSGYAPLASPALTGTPTAPTAAVGTSSTQVATTAFVASQGYNGINAQTGTTYTFVLTDANKLVTLSNASAITLTIPTNASVAFTAGQIVDISQIGAGRVTVVGAGGVTVNSATGLITVGQYSSATLVFLGSNTWLLVGNTSTT